jgi:hypothetical protein
MPREGGVRARDNAETPLTTCACVAQADASALPRHLLSVDPRAVMAEEEEERPEEKPVVRRVRTLPQRGATRKCTEATPLAPHRCLPAPSRPIRAGACYAPCALHACAALPLNAVVPRTHTHMHPSAPCSRRAAAWCA